MGAFAAIRRTATERFARQALAGIGDTQSAVNKDFEIERSSLRFLLRLEFLHLGQGDLAAEDGQGGTQSAGIVQPGATGHRHLRGSMNREIRRDAANQTADTRILHDGSVDPCGDDGAERPGGLG